MVICKDSITRRDWNLVRRRPRFWSKYPSTALNTIPIYLDQGQHFWMVDDSGHFGCSTNYTNSEMIKQHHFVLVHGGGHGAWCWYKIVSMLQNSGHKVTALDLAGCGTHPIDAERITTFAEYTQPLLDFLSQVQGKVILVGHSLGGVSVVHASELFPEKIVVGVYIAAAMFPVGLKSQESEINLARATVSFPDSMKFTFSRGVENGPTTVMVRKEYAREAFYHLSPPEDVALASILLRPSPIAAVSSVNFSTTHKGYGSVPRVFIKTEGDKSFSPKEQDLALNRSPPDKLYVLHSDHSPFFSTPKELHGVLLQIAQDYSSK